MARMPPARSMRGRCGKWKRADGRPFFTQTRKRRTQPGPTQAEQSFAANTAAYTLVAGVGDPGNAGAARTENAKTGISDPSYNSRKIYQDGKLHPDIRVPFREIDLAPTKTMTGEIEINEPVRVYDTSGPWGDADVDVEVSRGLPQLRAKWIRDRGDVEEYAGRVVQPIDDGFLSHAHAE